MLSATMIHFQPSRVRAASTIVAALGLAASLVSEHCCAWPAAQPAAPQGEVQTPELRADFAHEVERTWIGPDFFANRLQDWRLVNGRVECVGTGAKRPNRVLHWLTVEVEARRATWELEVQSGALPKAGDADHSEPAASWRGFLIGTGGPDVDWRLSALAHHRPGVDGGILAVVDGAGRAGFRSFEERAGEGGLWSLGGALKGAECAQLEGVERSGDGYGEGGLRDVRIRFRCEPEARGDRFRWSLAVHDLDDDALLSKATVAGVEARHVAGQLGLVSHRTAGGGSHWFQALRARGESVVAHPERRFGPILTAQYTVSRRRLEADGTDSPTRCT